MSKLLSKFPADFANNGQLCIEDYCGGQQSSPIPKTVPASIDSTTSGTTSAKLTIITPPSNDPSDTNTASLAVEMELLVATCLEPIPSTINLKVQPAKKHQLSTKPMHVSLKITAQCMVFMISLSSAGPTERNGTGDDADEE
ncbi:hypothetical protein BDR04DRAFT_1119393 [Suillus decipiens]|nr:hypothetical protein BDR04DRAFT_1119393 [Suillus decipiens]